MQETANMTDVCETLSSLPWHGNLVCMKLIIFNITFYKYYNVG